MLRDHSSGRAEREQRPVLVPPGRFPAWALPTKRPPPCATFWLAPRHLEYPYPLPSASLPKSCASEHIPRIETASCRITFAIDNYSARSIFLSKNLFLSPNPMLESGTACKHMHCAVSSIHGLGDLPCPARIPRNTTIPLPAPNSPMYCGFTAPSSATRSMPGPPVVARAPPKSLASLLSCPAAHADTSVGNAPVPG